MEIEARVWIRAAWKQPGPMLYDFAYLNERRDRLVLVIRCKVGKSSFETTLPHIFCTNAYTAKLSIGLWPSKKTLKSERSNCGTQLYRVSS